MSGFLGNTSSGTSTTVDGYVGLVQTKYTELAEDGYTIARQPVYSTLLSNSISTSGGDLIVNFSASFGANSKVSAAAFRVLLDGTLQRSVSTGFSSDETTQSVSIIFKRTVSSSVHTISVEWAKSALDAQFTSLRILAETEPELYHASLLLQEVQ